MALGVKVPIVSELNSKGFRQAIAEFKKLENNTQRFQFLMKKALTPAGITAISSAVAGAAYAMFDMANAAAQDSREQTTLATTLRNVTGATDDQIASTEKLISSMQMAYGVSDTQLRVGFANLTRATQDLTTAQNLLELAVNISAGTGKDLEGVTVALSKAALGQYTALKRLGVPLDENIVKTKDLGALTDYLSGIYGGAATANAQTLAGQMDILNQKYGEAKEKLGAQLTPALTDLVGALSDLVTALDFVGNAFTQFNDDLATFGDTILLMASQLPGLGFLWNEQDSAMSNAEDAAISAAGAFDRLQSELIGVWDAINYGKKPLNWMTQIGLPNLNAHLESLGYDTAIRDGNNFGSSLSQQETDLQRFTQSVVDAQNSLSGLITGYLDLNAAAKSGSLGGFVKGVTGQATQIKNFAKNLGILQARGLSPVALQGIMSLDLGTAASLTQDLVNSAFSGKYIKSLNQAYGTIQSTATSFGQAYGANFMTGGAIPVNIESVTVVSNDPDKFVRGLRKYQKRNGQIPIVTGAN